MSTGEKKARKQEEEVESVRDISNVMAEERVTMRMKRG
jgi:hypothetical protein